MGLCGREWVLIALVRLSGAFQWLPPRFSNSVELSRSLFRGQHVVIPAGFLSVYWPFPSSLSEHLNCYWTFRTCNSRQLVSCQKKKKKNLTWPFSSYLLLILRTVICIQTWCSLSPRLLYHTSSCPWLVSADCTNGGGCLLANSAVVGLMTDLTFATFHPQGRHNLRKSWCKEKDF